MISYVSLRNIVHHAYTGIGYGYNTLSIYDNVFYYIALWSITIYNLQNYRFYCLETIMQL